MKEIETINKLLEQKGISASRMMKELGFSSGLYSQWKKGAQKPSADKLQKIADYFNVSVDYILGNNPRDAVSDIFWATFINLCKKEGSDPITIGEHLGISPTAVASWGAGAMPAYSEMIMIAAYFNVTVGYLLGTENAAPEPKFKDDIQKELINLSPDEIDQVKDFLKYLEYKRGHQ